MMQQATSVNCQGVSSECIRNPKQLTDSVFAGVAPGGGLFFSSFLYINFLIYIYIRSGRFKVENTQPD